MNWLIRNLFCRWFGHRRGVFVSEAPAENGCTLRTFQCPRCKRPTRYIVKAEKNLLKVA